MTTLAFLLELMPEMMLLPNVAANEGGLLQKPQVTTKQAHTLGLSELFAR